MIVIKREYFWHLAAVEMHGQLNQLLLGIHSLLSVILI